MNASEQARADAMADAETLYQFAWERDHGRVLKNRSDLRKGIFHPRDAGAVCWAQAAEPDATYDYWRCAARGTFRAVPGLRGDR